MTTTNREILRLALPSILANITIPLVGIVDTAIVGHLSDAAAIGGIAIGTMLFDLLYWNFGFLRVGTSGLTAQAYGRGIPGECKKILVQSTTVALAAALVIWAIQWLFVTAVLAVVPCSPQAADVAREYFFVRIWAAPATLMLMAMKGWFIGMQDTRSPMAVDILVNVVNMVASYGLAVWANLGVVGVAWGTLIAQYCGLLLACTIMLKMYDLRFQMYDLRFQIYDFRFEILNSKYIALNGNLFVRSLCFMVVYVGFTSLAGRYGDTELAVSSILMKLFMFFSFFVDGFAYAGEALVGKAIGQLSAERSKWKEISSTVRTLFVWSLGVGMAFTALYALWGRECIELMTDNTEVLNASMPYMGWLIAMPIVSALAFMWDGVYVGATAGRAIRNAMIWAAVAFVAVYMAGEWLVARTAWTVAPLTVLMTAYFAHLAARVIYLTVKWKEI